MREVLFFFGEWQKPLAELTAQDASRLIDVLKEIRAGRLAVRVCWTWRLREREFGGVATVWPQPMYPAKVRLSATND